LTLIFHSRKDICVQAIREVYAAIPEFAIYNIENLMAFPGVVV
jgi:hypothetical protein